MHTIACPAAPTRASAIRRRLCSSHSSRAVARWTHLTSCRPTSASLGLMAPTGSWAAMTASARATFPLTGHGAMARSTASCAMSRAARAGPLAARATAPPTASSRLCLSSLPTPVRPRCSLASRTSYASHRTTASPSPMHRRPHVCSNSSYSTDRAAAWTQSAPSATRCAPTTRRPAVHRSARSSRPPLRSRPTTSRTSTVSLPFAAAATMPSR
mmetsp:Transcript_42613/g.96334  ORF Transcript_42613/g.96334 Transcript_42613/m.96334 type:complete len:214 (-) Transcript_42613:743-1384(-)